MVHVIASISVGKGKMADILKIYETFVPEVNREEGCLMYLPTVDSPTDIPTQMQDSHVITVMEQWEDMDAFKRHLSAFHVLRFREKVKGLVEKVSIKVLQAALV